MSEEKATSKSAEAGIRPLQRLGLTFESAMRRIVEVEASLGPLQAERTTMQQAIGEERFEAEGPSLVRSARHVLWALWGVVVLAAPVVVVLAPRTASYTGLALLCAVLGLQGSAISAGLSALERRANGWELSNGDVWPPGSDKKERFNQRMVPFFFARPLLGGALACVVALVWLARSEWRVHDSQELGGLLGFAFLSGLFAKSLIERTKELFDQLIGK